MESIDKLQGSFKTDICFSKKSMNTGNVYSSNCAMTQPSLPSVYENKSVHIMLKNDYCKNRIVSKHNLSKKKYDILPSTETIIQSSVQSSTENLKIMTTPTNILSKEILSKNIMRHQKTLTLFHFNK